MSRSLLRLAPLSGAVLSALSFATSSPAFAQEDDEVRVGLEEIIVTARFRDENLQRTPVAITAVLGEELTAMGFTNMSEMGRAVPNAYFRQGASPWGRSNQVFIRGVGQADFQFTQEPRTATYIDDVYFASVFGSVFDLLDLQQVEVLRGPQGTLFGRNAMGGAIRIVSKKPEGGGTGNLEATFGDFDRVDLRGSFDQTLVEDKLFLRVSGVSKHRDGYQQQLDFTCAMIAQGTPQLAGLGDGVVGWTAGVGPIMGTPNSAADNAFSFPSVRPGGGAIEQDCKIADLGGEDVQAGRAMLRWVPSDRFEANLTAHYSNDDSSVQAMYLAGVGNAAGVSNTVPGTTTGLPAGVIAYNNNVIGPTWGIAYDSRFIPRDPFSTYATYDDPIRNEQYPPVSTAKNQGWSTTFDWTYRREPRAQAHRGGPRDIRSVLARSGRVAAAVVQRLGAGRQRRVELRGTALGHGVQRSLRLDRRHVLLGGVSNQRRPCLAAVLRASVPDLRYRGHERRREQRYLLPLDHELDRSVVVDGRTALVGRRQDLHVQSLLRRDRAWGRRVGRLEARARLSAQRYGDGLLLERVRVHGEHVQRPAVHS